MCYWVGDFVVFYSIPLCVDLHLPAEAGDIRDAGSIPGLGRSPRGGHGNSLQYYCLENPMERGAWRATVHGLQKLDMTEANEHAHTS